MDTAGDSIFEGVPALGPGWPEMSWVSLTPWTTTGSPLWTQPCIYKYINKIVVDHEYQVRMGEQIKIFHQGHGFHLRTHLENLYKSLISL